MENPETPGTNSMVLACYHTWAICVVKLWNDVRIIILLQFELMTFRFALGRTLKPLISMISGFSDASPSPKTNLIYLGRPQDPSNNPRNVLTHVPKYCVL